MRELNGQNSSNRLFNLFIGRGLRESQGFVYNSPDRIELWLEPVLTVERKIKVQIL